MGCTLIFPPRIALWVRAFKITARLVEMTSPAKRLQALYFPPCTTELHRDDVIDFEPPGLAALDAAPAVPVQDGPPHHGPPARVGGCRVLNSSQGMRPPAWVGTGTVGRPLLPAPGRQQHHRGLCCWMLSW